MGTMNYDETENKRADEETKTVPAGSISGGGSDAGGKDNKRADFKVIERRSGGPTTTGSDNNPGPVMEFDEMGGA